MSDKELLKQIASIINSGHIQGYDIRDGYVMNIIDLCKQHLTQEWIPVSERLPELVQDVLVSINNDGYVFTTVAYLGRHDWSVNHNITHWQPLPAPPEDMT